MCDLKSYWELDGDMPKFPSLKALKQAVFEVIKSCNNKMPCMTWFYYHVVNGKRVSMACVEIESDGTAHFSRPQRL